MPFGVKNAGATYQQAMNYIFHDLIGDCLEVYIDDVVVKSHSFEQHLGDLEKAFVLMRHYKLKLNPLKCTFAMTKGNFLGFTVHEHGIEVDREKAQAILCAQPPTSKKELQRLIGKVNFLRHFTPSYQGRSSHFLPYSKLLKEVTSTGRRNTSWRSFELSRP